MFLFRCDCGALQRLILVLRVQVHLITYLHTLIKLTRCSTAVYSGSLNYQYYTMKNYTPLTQLHTH